MGATDRGRHPPQQGTSANTVLTGSARRLDESRLAGLTPTEVLSDGRIVSPVSAEVDWSR